MAKTSFKDKNSVVSYLPTIKKQSAKRLKIKLAQWTRQQSINSSNWSHSRIRFRQKPKLTVSTSKVEAIRAHRRSFTLTAPHYRCIMGLSTLTKRTFALLKRTLWAVHSLSCAMLVANRRTESSPTVTHSCQGCPTNSFSRKLKKLTGLKYWRGRHRTSSINHRRRSSQQLTKSSILSQFI